MPIIKEISSFIYLAPKINTTINIKIIILQ